MTLDEIHRELMDEERAAWRAAELARETGDEENALTQTELASLLYASATLVRRAIAVESLLAAAA